MKQVLNASLKQLKTVHWSLS